MGAPRLDSYDKNDCPAADSLMRMEGERFRFHRADVLNVEIEPTDLLFIDTWHTYDQLSAELRLHAGKVRKWIVLHDTAKHAEVGDGGQKGLRPAIEEFLALGTFRVAEVYENNNGLTVLERIDERC